VSTHIDVIGRLATAGLSLVETTIEGGPKEGRNAMPPATPEQYREMLDAAQRRNYAYPAVNVSSSDTLNAALRGFAEAGSDGIIQVRIGAADAPCRIAERRARGELPLYHSHMFDGSALPLEENLRIAVELLHNAARPT
jgi:fructose-bisphosphate aldolase class II